MGIPKEHKIVAVSQLITAAGMILLWLSFYFLPIPTDPDAYRFEFDAAYPLVDGILEEEGVSFLCCHKVTTAC